MEQLTINKDCTPEQFDHYCTRLTQAGKAYRFALGDMVALAQSKKWLGRDAFKKLQKETGYKLRTLEQFAQVARAFPPESRTAELDFSHFSEVASLPEKERGLMIKEAEEKGLSVRKLRGRLRPKTSNKPLPSERIEEAVTLTIGRQNQKVRKTCNYFIREKTKDPDYWEQCLKDRATVELYQKIDAFIDDPIQGTIDWCCHKNMDEFVENNEVYGLRETGDYSGLNEDEQMEFSIFCCSRYCLLENAVCDGYASPDTHTMAEGVELAIERWVSLSIVRCSEHIHRMIS